MHYKAPYKNSNIVVRALEVILCLYIIIVPVTNSLSIQLFGYAIQVYIAVIVIVFALLSKLLFQQTSQNNYFGLCILTAFIFLLLIHKFRNTQVETGVFLLILLYISFLTLPKEISRKKIYTAYYLAAILAASYTMIIGLSENTITRTATSVDGSIGLIVLTICLFLKEDFEQTGFYRAVKVIALVSSLVVLGFGMSRARLSLGVLILAIKLFWGVVRIVRTGRIKVILILALPIFIAASIFVFRLDAIQDLIDEISLRFERGFESLGRSEEIRFGWSLFREHFIIGNGFGTLTFVDYQNYDSLYFNHCMYVAILARGGLVLAVPFFMSFAAILKSTVKSKNLFLCLVMGLFFVLGYGNAGLFNYTNVSFLIPLIIELRSYESEERVYTKNACDIYSKR